METSLKQRLILIIDGNDAHVQTIKATLAASDVGCEIRAIASGEEALRYLNQQGDYAGDRRPDLILLELNLPNKNGLDILSEIKKTPHLKRIPIVVLTLSDEDINIFNSYALQGNCYVLKSSNLDQLAHIVKRIEEFWLGIVTLPVE